MYRTAMSVDRNKLYDYINSFIIRSYPNIPSPSRDKHTVPYSDKLEVFLGPLATALNSFGGEGVGRVGIPFLVLIIKVTKMESVTSMITVKFCPT